MRGGRGGCGHLFCLAENFVVSTDEGLSIDPLMEVAVAKEEGFLTPVLAAIDDGHDVDSVDWPVIF